MIKKSWPSSSNAFTAKVMFFNLALEPSALWKCATFAASIITFKISPFKSFFKKFYLKILFNYNFSMNDFNSRH